MPELPEPFDLNEPQDVHDFVGGHFCAIEYVNIVPPGEWKQTKFDANDLYSATAHDIASFVSDAELFTAEQVKAYGEACYRKALEDAARECEAQVRATNASDAMTFYTAVDQCAAAIRALPATKDAP